jgi:hypothetical protein
LIKVTTLSMRINCCAAMPPLLESSRTSTPRGSFANECGHHDQQLNWIQDQHQSVHASSLLPRPTGAIWVVRNTERVLQCQVLRCQERATRNFVIDQGERGLFEAMVCDAHATALKAGERYVYNSVENVIYMGQDAPPTTK